MHLNPTITACWSPSGEQLKVTSAGNDRKFQVFGSVEYRTGELVYSQEDRKRTTEYVAHLIQVLSRWPDRPIIVVTDNYQVHKTAAVKELEKREFGRLLHVYLPTYSPHLNCIEMLWRHIRRLVTHNYFFGAIDGLKSAVGSALEQLSSQTHCVLSIIGGKPLQQAEAT